MRRASIPIVDDKRRPIMHHKFAVVDGQAVLTGSWNFTTGDTYRLNNNAVILRLPAGGGELHAEFEKMFVQRKFGPEQGQGGALPAGDGGRTPRWRRTSPRRTIPRYACGR